MPSTTLSVGAFKKTNKQKQQNVFWHNAEQVNVVKEHKDKKKNTQNQMKGTHQQLLNEKL